MAVKRGNRYVFESKGADDSNFALDGYHDKFNVKVKKEYEIKKHLPVDGTTDSMSCVIKAMKNENISVSTNYYPTTLAGLKKYYLVDGTVDDFFNIGIIDKKNSLYTSVDEAVIKSFTLEIPENGYCSCQLEYACQQITMNDAADYGTGVHATALVVNGLTTNDLSSTLFGTTSLNVTKLTLKVEYEMDETWNIELQKMEYSITGRKITISFSLADVPDAFITDVNNNVARDLAITLGGQTFTVKEVLFPDLELDVNVDDIVMENFASVECTEIEFGF